jgi:hypothetical protein
LVLSFDERVRMGLFDSIREKATEMLSGATEQVQEVAGNLPGGQAVEDLTGSATDAAGQVTEDATGAAQDLGADATGSVNEVTDTVSGSVADTTEAASETIDPYRP